MTRVQLGRNVFMPSQSDAYKKAVAKVAELLDVPQNMAYDGSCKDVGEAPSPITLVGPSGEQVELPAEIANAFRAVVSPMMDDRSVYIDPIDGRLDAEEAAGLLGLSTPEFVELLQAGEMSHVVSSDGKRYYVKLTDVLIFEARRIAEIRMRQEEMLEIEREGGFERTEEPVEIVHLGEF